MRSAIRSVLLYAVMPALFGLTLLAYGPLNHHVVAAWEMIAETITSGLNSISEWAMVILGPIAKADQSVRAFLQSNPGILEVWRGFMLYIAPPAMMAFVFVFARRTRKSPDETRRGLLIDVVGAVSAAYATYALIEYFSEIRYNTGIAKFFEPGLQLHLISLFLTMAALTYVCAIAASVENNLNEARKRQFLARKAAEVVSKESSELIEAIEATTGLDIDGNGDRPAPAHVAVAPESELKLEDIPIGRVTGVGRAAVFSGIFYTVALTALANVSMPYDVKFDVGLDNGMSQAEKLKASEKLWEIIVEDFYPSQPSKAMEWLREAAITEQTVDSPTDGTLNLQSQELGVALRCEKSDGRVQVQLLDLSVDGANAWFTGSYRHKHQAVMTCLMLEDLYTASAGSKAAGAAPDASPVPAPVEAPAPAAASATEAAPAQDPEAPTAAADDPAPIPVVEPAAAQ